MKRKILNWFVLKVLKYKPEQKPIKPIKPFVAPQTPVHSDDNKHENIMTKPPKPVKTLLIRTNRRFDAIETNVIMTSLNGKTKVHRDLMLEMIGNLHRDQHIEFSDTPERDGGRTFTAQMVIVDRRKPEQS